VGLIRELLGMKDKDKKAGPRSIAEVEAALGRLGAERAAARQAIGVAMSERDALLLVDESDKKIAELDQVADKHRLVVERCDAVEPKLLDELAGARTRRRQAEWAQIRALFYPQARRYVAAMRQAHIEFDAVIAIRGKGAVAGFQAEVGSMFAVPPQILSEEQLLMFERAAEHSESLASQPAPAPKLVPPSPLDVLVEITIPMLQLTGGPPARMGDRRRLPLSTAWQLMHQGSVRWVDGKAPPQPSPPRSGAKPAASPPPAPPEPIIEKDDAA
jgi:hypothetical protein